MNIKVIHNYPIWLPQTQTWMYNQARHLPKEVECHIVCERTENLEQFHLPNIHSLNQEPKWRDYLDRGLRFLHARHHLGFLVDQAKRQQAQVLHSHFGYTGWADITAAKKARLRHVVTFYGADIHYYPRMDPRWNDRYRTLFSSVDRVLCEGPHMAQCIEKLGCPEEKIVVHHLGVSVEEISFKPRIWNPNEPLRIFIAGSFREKKGIPVALEALGMLQHEIPMEISIVGDETGEERSRAEKQKILEVIRKHQLQSKTRLLGFQPHSVFFEEAYRHHIFLSPSVTAGDEDTEGGAPVTLIEAAATGMPIVSTVHCDIPEVIKHEVTGLLAPEYDVNGLVKHLKWMVDHPAQWSNMLMMARSHIEKEFNAPIQGGKLGKIYKELAD